jgi:hypothetical protein
MHLFLHGQQNLKAIDSPEKLPFNRPRPVASADPEINIQRSHTGIFAPL